MSITSVSDSFGIQVHQMKISQNQDEIDLVNHRIRTDLQKHKYILFKNQVDSAEEFLAFSNLIGRDFVSYKGGAYVREKVKKGNDTLLSVTGGSGMKMAIPMHGEMHYKKVKPELLWFCCHEAPLSNGETTLCDAEALFDSLSLAAQNLFIYNDITYSRTYDEARWTSVFQTSNIEDALPFFEANGLKFSMDNKKILTTSYVCSAIHTAPTGNRHFINNILPITIQERMGMPGNVVRLKNGDKIPAHIIDELIEKTNKLKINVNWEKGDILLIDNLRAMHGRNKITCDNRNIIVRMSN